MDESTYSALVILGGLVVLIVGVPLWLVAKVRERRRSRERARLYQEEFSKAHKSMLEDRAFPSLDAATFGYRRVGGENLIGIQNGVSRLEFKGTGGYRSRGASVSIPIMGGIRYRIGSGTVAATKAWQVTASGRLVVTDRALSFESAEKNERITWSQISNVEIFQDGFRVAKRSGPPRLYTVNDPKPKFAAVLALALSVTE